MPLYSSTFEILEQVDSTNNYAMGTVHAGLAKHGHAVFSPIQTEGKGQRGKVWETGAGQNIALSVLLDAKQLNFSHPFQLSVIIALATYDFFSKYAGEETKIKWPNDIFWRDRKAGGVLIENQVTGKKWKWAVVGIGINVNQTAFVDVIRNPVSLKQITGKNFEAIELAKELHSIIMQRVDEFSTKGFERLLKEYHQHLYKINTVVKFKKGNMVFETLVTGVSPQGQLITIDSMERHFGFGEITWIL